MELLAPNLGCQIETLPTKYLDMPFGSTKQGHKSVECTGEMLQETSKLERSIPSLGGRLTLVKLVPNALPSYIMSHFSIPKSIVRKINKLRRSFLWNGNRENRGYKLVKWDIVTLSRKHGTLVIKKLGLHYL